MRLQIQVPDQGQKAQESSKECLNSLLALGLGSADSVGAHIPGYKFPFPSISGSKADFEAT